MNYPRGIILGETEPVFIPSLRTEFAKAALQGLLASGADKKGQMKKICVRALNYADIMVEELEKAERRELEKHKESE